MGRVGEGPRLRWQPPRVLALLALAGLAALAALLVLGAQGAAAAEGEEELKIKWVDSPLPGPYLGVTTDSEYIYIAATTGLLILNYSSVDSPSEVSFIGLPGTAEEVVVINEYAFVADGGKGLWVMDVSNRSEPERVGFYDTPGYATDVNVLGDYAYVADGDRGLRIIDISNPSKLKEVGFNDTPGKALEVVVNDSLAYIADGEGGLRVINISDPNNPIEIGYNDEMWGAKSLDISDNTVYVGAWWYRESGFKIINVSDPTNPILENTIPTGTDAEVLSVVIVGNYSYILETDYEDIMMDRGEDFIKIYNISNLHNPIKENEFRIGYDYGSNDFLILDELAFTVDYYRNLRLYQIVNSTQFEKKGEYKNGGYTVDVSVANNYIYLADKGSWNGIVDNGRGLWIVNATHPESASPVGYLYTSGIPRAVSVVNDYAFLAMQVSDKGSLDIIDIENPKQPRKVSQFNLPGRAISMDIYGDYAYVGLSGWDINGQTEPGGLWILNVSNPESPVEVSNISTSGPVKDITVSGNYSYLALDEWKDGQQWRDGGLLIINISDPENLTMTSETNAVKNGKGISINGEYIYVADGDRGLRIVDVSNVSQPTLVKTIQTTARAKDIKLMGDMAVLIDVNPYSRSSTVRVFNISDPNSTQEVAYLTRPSQYNRISLQDNYLYLAADSRRLEILQINKSGNDEPSATIDSISPSPATEGEAVTLAGSGSDADGAIIGWEWRSDLDGLLGSAATVTVANLTPGDHNLTFRVQDDWEAWSLAATATLHVNARPTAEILPIPHLEGCRGQKLQVNFTAQASDPEGLVVVYQWDLDGDGIYDYTGPGPEVAVNYTLNGTTPRHFSPRLRVQDNEGAWSEVAAVDVYSSIRTDCDEELPPPPPDSDGGSGLLPGPGAAVAVAALGVAALLGLFRRRL